MNKLTQNSKYDKLVKSMASLYSEMEKFLKNQAFKFDNNVRDIAKSSLTMKGKYLRPTLVFAAAYDGIEKNKEALVKRAAIIELIHLSTLIHDDVLDNAALRRNQETINSKYDAKTAILLGDAIFAHTIILTLQEDDTALSQKIAETVKIICEGEIKQTLSDKAQKISKSLYYKMVYGKTGVLFQTACYVGAITSNADKAWQKAVEDASKEFGIAYQIYDDICDWFMSEKNIGKTLGTDLISCKQTYPLIILLEKLPMLKANKLLKNLAVSSYDDVLKLMEEFDIYQECKKDYVSRINKAQKILKKFPKKSEKLLEFSQAMLEFID